MKRMNRSQKEKTWDVESAMADLHGGLTVKEVAEKHRRSYGDVYYAAKRRGISGGWIQRDKRPLAVRIKERLKVQPNGCIKWEGPNVTFTGSLRIPSQYANFIFGTKFNYYANNNRRICPTIGCLNQEHFLGRNFERDEEIRAAWRRYQEAKTTLQEMGNKYGLTRQRVEQILKYETA